MHWPLKKLQYHNAQNVMISCFIRKSFCFWVSVRKGAAQRSGMLLLRISSELSASAPELNTKQFSHLTGVFSIADHICILNQNGMLSNQKRKKYFSLWQPEYFAFKFQNVTLLLSHFLFFRNC